MPLQEAQETIQEGQKLIREVWVNVADFYLNARAPVLSLSPVKSAGQICLAANLSKLSCLCMRRRRP